MKLYTAMVYRWKFRRQRIIKTLMEMQRFGSDPELRHQTSPISLKECYCKIMGIRYSSSVDFDNEKLTLLQNKLYSMKIRGELDMDEGSIDYIPTGASRIKLNVDVVRNNDIIREERVIKIAMVIFVFFSAASTTITAISVIQSWFE